MRRPLETKFAESPGVGRAPRDRRGLPRAAESADQATAGNRSRRVWTPPDMRAGALRWSESSPAEAHRASALGARALPPVPEGKPTC